MTLLDDLQALDLSSILDAKADISLTINSDDLLALVGDGAATSVLGDLGTVIQLALDGFDDPAALVEPILSAFSAVLGELDADIALDDYVEAVTVAARIVADLVAMISGDPHRIGFGGGLDIGDALERVGGHFGDHAAVVSGNLAKVPRARAVGGTGPAVGPVCTGGAGARDPAAVPDRLDRRRSLVGAAALGRSRSGRHRPPLDRGPHRFARSGTCRRGRRRRRGTRRRAGDARRSSGQHRAAARGGTAPSCRCGLGDPNRRRCRRRHRPARGAQRGRRLRVRSARRMAGHDRLRRGDGRVDRRRRCDAAGQRDARRGRGNRTRRRAGGGRRVGRGGQAVVARPVARGSDPLGADAVERGDRVGWPRRSPTPISTHRSTPSATC